MMQPLAYDSTPDAADHARLHNFSAGPGTLPLEVILEVREELPVYGDLGSSIMEISHRSPAYTEVTNSAVEALRSLLGLGDDWHVLFLQGGASMQFHQVPVNFLPAGGSADYLNTGTWSQKAIKEAHVVGQHRGAAPHVVATSEDKNFSYIPDRDGWEFGDDAAYLHYTSNNTIFGTQFAEEPEAAVPLVCDASSDFLSRPLAAERYGLIYAGAQKNIGPAGATVILVQDGFLRQRQSGLPTMLDYGTHAAKLFNTPPVFAVYIIEKVLRWLQGVGGLQAMEQQNDEKAARLYGAIDATDFYRGTAREDSRSRMNVTFRIKDGNEDLEARFIQEAKGEGLLALKGHRSVGGLRASIYNACAPASVEALVQFMEEFERTRG
ncbi:MAG: 3-phosphoserine/phosphohydroxythreonine transaminase [Bacteroidota bacterium]